MYAIVDIETTGGHASSNGITEIAVCLHDGLQVVDRFETLLNPGYPIPPYIVSLTGISPAMVASAPRFEEVAGRLHEMLSGTVFVAHNVNFDYSFVKHHLRSAGFELQTPKLCTIRLSRKVFPGLPSYSLGNLCRSLGIDVENRHRAGGDAAATVELFDHLLRNDAHKHIEQMLRKTSGEQWLPIHIDREQIDLLPPTPGVYYFLNQKKKVIYVGKALNVRKRVSSHFTTNGPDRKRQNLMRQIHSIQYKTCSTELEAIVLESTEIRRLWPYYNVSQKRGMKKYGLYEYTDSRGYRRLVIDTRKKNLPALYRFNLLQEGMNLLKKLIAAHGLHEKLCYVNQTAMDEEDRAVLEDPEAYNRKVDRALDALGEWLPTFAVVDKGLRKSEKLCLLVERGSFWGMGYVSDSLDFSDLPLIKQHLQPYHDNDTIRSSIYSFLDQYPSCRVNF
jgi:DNA polymerase-3 subunit epsilon